MWGCQFWPQPLGILCYKVPKLTQDKKMLKKHFSLYHQKNSKRKRPKLKFKTFWNVIVFQQNLIFCKSWLQRDSEAVGPFAAVALLFCFRQWRQWQQRQWQQRQPTFRHLPSLFQCTSTLPRCATTSSSSSDRPESELPSPPENGPLRWDWLTGIKSGFFLLVTEGWDWTFYVF